jgi:hypothetical protein
MTWVDTNCQQTARERALADIEEFGNAEVKNIAVEVGIGNGSDDQFQYARVAFEYRKRNEIDWQDGQIRILTDHAVPGFRYTCGNVFNRR